jgi:GWxTD domain-containing protein
VHSTTLPFLLIDSDANVSVFSKLQTKKRLISPQIKKNINRTNTRDMKRCSLYIILFLLSSFNLLNAKNLQANFQYFTFQNEEGQVYIETYFSFLSTQINYEKVEENTFQGTVLVELTIMSGEETTHLDKYLFKTPLITDTLNAQIFIDKQIYALSNGDYTLDLKLSDKNSGALPIHSTTELTIDYKEDEISFSDFMILESYTVSDGTSILNKSGYDLIPSFGEGAYFLDDNDTQLDFYIEWYNTHKDTATSNGYLLNYYIENEQTHTPLTGFNSIKRKTKDKQKAFLGGFNITELVSGNYNLVVALLDREGRGIIQKRVFFQRRNSSTVMKPQDYASILSPSSFAHQFEVIEQLAEHISSLLPIATKSEWKYATNQLENWDLEQMKQYFHGFWYNRSPLDPESEWLKYLKGVEKVNELYSTINIKGFATDRGRVLLKYGTPNDLENSVYDRYTLPYQIWTYYKVENQTNIIFVFVENALGTNDYELLHSTLRGEKNNKNWRNWIFRERGAVKDLDNENENRDLDFNLNNNLDDKGNRNQVNPGDN